MVDVVKLGYIEPAPNGSYPTAFNQSSYANLIGLSPTISKSILSKASAEEKKFSRYNGLMALLELKLGNLSQAKSFLLLSVNSPEPIPSWCHSNYANYITHNEEEYKKAVEIMEVVGGDH